MTWLDEGNLFPTRARTPKACLFSPVCSDRNGPIRMQGREVPNKDSSMGAIMAPSRVHQISEMGDGCFEWHSIFNSHNGAATTVLIRSHVRNRNRNAVRKTKTWNPYNLVIFYSNWKIDPSKLKISTSQVDWSGSEITKNSFFVRNAVRWVGVGVTICYIWNRYHIPNMI